MIEYEGGLSYLELEDALILFAVLFECSLQEARDQLRSIGGLEGALARPVQYAFYEEADIALQAAVLAHGIAENQPFIDGNKRMAYLACKTFLEENAYVLTIEQEEVAAWIYELSEGRDEHWLATRLHPVIEHL